ncbi:MAG TPA: carbohydrate ABC transporter permease [Erysipelothrix sp.]
MKKNKSFSQNILTYLALVLFSLYFIAPFLWMIITALKSPEEVNTYPPTFIPRSLQWKNFMEAWQSQPFGLYFYNSFKVTLLSTIGQVFSSAFIAFGFARYDFKFKNFLFILLLGSMMLPWDVTMIPLYMQFNRMGWINSLKPLIVPSFFGSAYYIFLLRQFLMDIPNDIENAARIDGASDFKIFYKIFLPIMKAPLILIAILNMLTVWNDYLGPLIFLQDRDKYTLALGLASFKGLHNTNIIPIMAMTVLMVIPPVIIFYFAQKYIIEGVSGSIK